MSNGFPKQVESGDPKPASHEGSNAKTRKPTDAEKRAHLAAFNEIVRQATADERVIHIENSPIGPYHATIDGDIDLMAVTRAVIRSLREPTADMVAAGNMSKPEDPEIDLPIAFPAMIDTASPEVKP